MVSCSSISIAGRTISFEIERARRCGTYLGGRKKPKSSAGAILRRSRDPGRVPVGKVGEVEGVGGRTRGASNYIPTFGGRPQLWEVFGSSDKNLYM